MKKNKGIHFIIPLVIYPFEVMVSIAETNGEVKRILKRYGNSDEDTNLLMFLTDTVQGRTAMLDTNQTVIRIRHYPKSAEQLATLQHEIFHAVTFIMDRIGIILKICESDEAYAYLIGYLTKEIYKKLNNHGRRI